MRTPVKLVAFGAVLVAAFGIAAAVGTAVGPIDPGRSDHDVPDTTLEVPHEHGN